MSIITPLKRLLAVLGSAAALLACPAATAQQVNSLRIGLSADVTSMDPHWNNSGPNNAMAHHIFESLVRLDRNGRYVPGLALSWKSVNAITWEIRLRPNVRWHDGKPLTAEDVKASLERPERLVNSPGPFTSYTKSIARIQIVNPLTLRLTVSVPNYASIANDLSSVAILPKEVAGMSQFDFDNGSAMIGTGPFRFVRFARGQEIVLERNPDYWGGAPQWDKVTFRILSDSASRTAALLSGEVDVIEAVPTTDLQRLRLDGRFRIEQQVSWRTIFWQMDQERDVSPFLTDLQGAPLTQNPLKDLRVRRAISKAINRPALVSRIMEGQAIAASALVSPQIFGHPGGLPDEYDPEGAKRLLAEAGYPNGFGLTIHATNNRYLNDAQIAQATAQMLARVGIRAKVEAMPVAIYFTRARQQSFSFAMLGWGSVAGDVALRSILGTADAKTGYGTWNWGRFSDPKLDAMIARSLATVSSEREHEANAKDAVKYAMSRHALIPSHHQIASWAMQKGLAYTGRTDEWSLAHHFTRQ